MFAFLIIQLGPMDTLSPRTILPSRITFTSIEQSFPHSTLPLTSSLDASVMVIPFSNKSSACIALYVASNCSSSCLLFAPLTSSFEALYVLILIPFSLITETKSVK